MKDGSMRLPLVGDQFFTVFGGPFQQAPTHMYNVKMAEEIDRFCDIDIPTPDYHTPDPFLLGHGLYYAVQLILDRQPLYVGCFGGLGRTGLFLAILAKAFDIEHPIQYVREQYMDKAIETEEQEEYIANFPIPADIKAMIARARWRYVWQFWKRNLTRTWMN